MLIIGYVFIAMSPLGSLFIAKGNRVKFKYKLKTLSGCIEN